MPRRPRTSAAVRRRITELDGQRCAYCRSPMAVGIPMVVEHIIPLVANGPSTIDNICLACYRCNEFKGPRTEAPDPYDGQISPLFHPRQQQWRDHFAWSEDGSMIPGLTPCGRATIGALRLKRNQESLAIAQDLSHPFSLTWALDVAAWFHRSQRCQSPAGGIGITQSSPSDTKPRVWRPLSSFILSLFQRQFSLDLSLLRR